MMRNVLAILLILSVPVTAAQADECEQSTCFNVGSFNIKMLGGSSAPANTQSEIRELVRRIARDADLDIVVLQEIDIRSSVWNQRLLPELQDNGYALAGYGAFGGSNENRQQHVVLLFRESSVSSLGPVRDIDIPTTYEVDDCEYDSVRPPTVGRLKVLGTTTTLTVVGVHLKSQRPPGDVEDCDDEIREFQAAAIVDDVRPILESDSGEFVMAIGDFNGQFSAEEFDVFREAGMDTVVPNDCDRPSREGCTYLIRRWAGVIDHIVLPTTTIDESWISTTIEGAEDIDDYLDTQSDHALVWARFLAEDEQ